MNAFIHFLVSLFFSLAGYFQPAAGSSQYINAPSFVKQHTPFASSKRAGIQADKTFIAEAGRGHRNGEADPTRDAETEIREEETEGKNEKSPGSKKLQDFGSHAFLLSAVANGNDHSIIEFTSSVNQFDLSNDRYILYSSMRI